MGSVKATWTMLRCMIFKGFVQWRFLAALIVMIVMTDTVPPFIQAIMETGEVSGMHFLEPAILTFSGFVSEVYMVMVLIWMCDAPFFDQNEVLVVQRTNRWQWIATRILYVLIGIAVFIAIQTAYVTLRCLPYATPGYDMLSENYYGASSVVPEDPVIPVMWAFWVNFLLNWMAACIYVLLMFAINMRHNHTVGMATGIAYWTFDTVLGLNLMGINSAAAYLSPWRLKSLMLLASRYTPESIGPTVTEAFLVMGGVMIALIIAILLLTPGYAFPFMKVKQGRISE